MNEKSCKATMTVGVMMCTGGLFSALSAVTLGGVHVTGFGPFSGYWTEHDYFLIGTFFVVAGSGLLTLGILNRRG